MRTDADFIKDAGYDMVVVDEIHEITSPELGKGSGRYQGMVKLKDIPLKIGMSGTNIKNRKSELYKKINFLDPDHTLGSLKDFGKRYKGLNQGTSVFQSSANEAFRKEISPWVYSQKNVIDVKHSIEKIRVPLTPEQRNAYSESERIYRAEKERNLRGATARRDERIYDITHDGKALENSRANKIVEIMNQSHTGEKAVIHVTKLNAMRTIKERLEKEYGKESVVLVHGKMRQKEVEEAKAAFNNLDNPARFIIGTKSLENGHNLQHGGTVTFQYDIPDTYASFDQRNKRIYRRGQNRDVKTYVLSGLNPLDMRKEDILQKKKREMEILGNPREIEGFDEDGFLSLLNQYEQEAA
jgi:superfamily II DNA or RNA helicase